jgi:ubiquinone/menaquinone biosynthesis C-methylase UbiE
MFYAQKTDNPEVNWDFFWRGSGNSLGKRVFDWCKDRCAFEEFICAKVITIALDHLQKDGVLVEVGCGMAHTSKGIQLRLPRVRMILMDLSLGPLKALRGVAGQCAVNADMYHIPLKDAACDCCVNVGTVEHLSDPVSSLQEMHRVTKGIVISAVPASSIIWKFSTMIRRIVEKDSSLWTEHTRYYSKAQFHALGVDAGLINIRVFSQTFCLIPCMHILVGQKDDRRDEAH